MGDKNIGHTREKEVDAMRETQPAMSDLFWTMLMSPDKKTEYEALGQALAAYLPEDHVLVMTRIERRISLAAICLKGQPFGFTREDVELIRGVAVDMSESARVNDRPTGRSAQYAALADDLATRIEALLPPEKT